MKKKVREMCNNMRQVMHLVAPVEDDSARGHDGVCHGHGPAPLIKGVGQRELVECADAIEDDHEEDRCGSLLESKDVGGRGEGHAVVDHIEPVHEPEGHPGGGGGEVGPERLPDEGEGERDAEGDPGDDDETSEEERARLFEGGGRGGWRGHSVSRHPRAPGEDDEQDHADGEAEGGHLHGGRVEVVLGEPHRLAEQAWRRHRSSRNAGGGGRVRSHLVDDGGRDVLAESRDQCPDRPRHSGGDDGGKTAFVVDELDGAAGHEGVVCSLEGGDKIIPSVWLDHHRSPGHGICNPIPRIIIACT
mmetsp:Transcript_4760/g.14621  ORF Transcript_4760/g.14621 Transcript_4760/m.14621 type:complete len:303 (-) Transcript_4760:390-1298(-)